MNLGEAVDLVEVSKLRYEVHELKAAKSDFEKVSASLKKEKYIYAEKVFSLLSKKYELIIEYDSFGANVKTLQCEASSLKSSIDFIKKEFASKERFGLVRTEKEKLTKLDDISAQLVRAKLILLSPLRNDWSRHEEAYLRGLSF